MIANDELQDYMCRKYQYECERCTASLVGVLPPHNCSFDAVDNCLIEYKMDVGIIKEGDAF